MLTGAIVLLTIAGLCASWRALGVLTRLYKVRSVDAVSPTWGDNRQAWIINNPTKSEYL